MKLYVLCALLLCCAAAAAQHMPTPFELSGGKRTATYAECIAFYYRLQSATGRIRIDSMSVTDAGYPLHTIIYPATATPDAHALTILINNGIHAGEPDGIDASMMLLRDIAEGRLSVPAHVRLVVIPVYNIGGALNRNNGTRVNQVGPESYGFRGNAQNLDLNRDFTKCDARESRLFAQIFHRYDPAIFIDNHVSDGADYQHTMTLLSTQYDKLGGALGAYFRRRLDPLLYYSMDVAGWPMSPYVNAEETPDKGWTAFYDPPRFSSGYAALFNCIAWVPETHMLKPFDQRVKSTYVLMKAIIALAGSQKDTILALRRKDRENVLRQAIFPLAWKAGSTTTIWPFKGYAAAYKQSEVTGQQRLYYDHSKPLNITVPIRDHYVPAFSVKAPQAYIIPQGWHAVIERLLDNRRLDYGILDHDTAMMVTAYTIDSFKTSPTPYEKHYKHSAIHVTPTRSRIKFLKGDYVFDLADNPCRRFLIETLEPEGEDSYFAWNFFDAILQRKEGYSDYRWEDVAAQELRGHPDIKAALEAQKRKDPAFAKDAAAQLFYVYRHSRWYEAAHMRYPVTALSNHYTMEEQQEIKLPFYARLAFLLLSIMLIFLIMYEGKSIIIPLFFSLLIALMLLPVTKWLERRKLPRSPAAIISILLFIIFIGGVFYFLGAQIADFSKNLPQLATRMQAWVTSLQGWVAAKYHIDASSQLNYLNKGAADFARYASVIAQALLLAVGGFAIWTIFVFIFTFFMLTHRALLMNFITCLFQRKDQPRVNEILTETRLLANSYILGLLIEMVIVAALNCIVFLICGVKYALLLGILAAVLNIIPYLGIYTATAIAALITLSSSTPNQALVVIVILIAVHFIDANVLMPRIVGRRVKMNPLITIIAVLVGHLLWGIPGMFLFIPLAGMLKIVFERVDGLKPWAILMGTEEEAKNDSPKKSKGGS